MKLLITLSQNGFEWAWKTSIYATLLIVLVFLLQKLLAKWLTPRLRYALSLLVLIRLWLPIVPSSSLSFENLFPQSARLMQPAAVLPISGLPLEEVISVHQSVISPVSAPAVDHPRGIFASGAIGLGWAAGCLCLLSLAGWRYWKWNRLIKLGRPISDPKLIDLLNSAGEAMRVRSAVTLVAVSQLGSPAVFGFRRVRLLLPEAVLRQLNDQELRLIFLHEMAHVRRKDVLLNFLLITVQFLHWFNPFVWLALHRLRADRELVCDAMVMQRVGPEERPGYGKVLLKLMDGFSVGHRVFASAVPVVGSKHEIKRRIIMIKHHRRSSIAACVATALMVTALGCATFTRAGGEKQQGKLIENPPSVAQHPTQENTTVLAKKGPSGGLVGKEPTLTDGASKESAARAFYERAMKHYIAGGQQFPDSAARAKEYEEQLEYLNKALELDPMHAEALFSRGSLYGFDLPMDKRDYAKAAADYTRLLDIKPRDCSGRHNRALCYEQLREYDKAIADYTRIIEGDTDFSRFLDGKDKQLALDYHYRGRMYFDKTDYARAVADFNEALRLDPEIAKSEASGRIILRRGQAYHALKEYNKAQDDFARYMAIDPEYFELWQSWAWQLATCPDARFRDGRKALEYANKVASATTGPRQRGVADGETRAAAYAELGQFAEAVKWQKKALDSLGPTADDKRKAMEARLRLYEAQRPFRNE